MSHRLVLLAVALLTLAAAASAHACPMCKDTVADAGNSAISDPSAPTPGDMTGAGAAATSPGLSEAFSYSVLFMLAVPYTLLAAGGTTAFILYRRRQRPTARPA